VWIEGGGWDPARWGRWPTAGDLRGVATDRRVALWSHDHHALWVSDRVLRELGVDAATPDPPGGAYRRIAAGEPDGVLQETAVGAVVARLPAPDQAALERAIATYAGTLLALGVTGVHDPGDLLADATLSGGIAAITALADRDELAIRVHCSVREQALATAIERGLRTGDALGESGRTRMGWLKLFADGALGSRTAQLIDPYEGTAADRGIAVTPPAHLAALARRAAASGIVPQIHAIGDAALRSALDALEPVAPAAGPMARVEHVQFADPADLPRFSRARIAASIQPIHLRSDVAKAREAWGDRAERRGFLLRSLVDASIATAFGTDAPVEPADPWPGLALAVTRHAPEWPDDRPFGPDQAIALDHAVRAATIGPHAIAGDPLGGRLVPGARADFIAIPAAALREPVEPGGPLHAARPAFVALDGKVAFES
jgi:predicted amidohydrolase YtcJ